LRRHIGAALFDTLIKDATGLAAGLLHTCMCSYRNTGMNDL